MHQPIFMCQGFMTEEKDRALWVQVLQKATEPQFADIDVNELDFYEFNLADLLIQEASRSHNAKAIEQVAEELRGVAAMLDMVAHDKVPAP
jgi:hypothetical protein